MAARAVITPVELAARLERGPRPAILDVRTSSEFAAGHVPGAVNVPFTEIGARLSEIPAGPEDELVVYCGHGPRAWIAGGRLGRRGFRRLVYLGGHWAAWRRAGLPEEV
jgi:rhodanese-related sulfurtransferase